jgi:uncharacterized membrane protein YoaK (UPF0700 family)
VSLADYYLRDRKHGPLPVLLTVLTIATGVVDAVSILALGRVFVANMTGNIAFIGFALAGAPGFSLSASLIALAGFLIGAAAGGWAADRYGGHRGRLLRNVMAAEFGLLVLATVAAGVDGAPLDSAGRDVTVALAALALGLQNAAVRRLAVPDLTTTVLTMTLTGIAADLRARNLLVVVRRLVSVAAMLLGAAAGTLLVLHADPYAGLAVAAALVLVVLAGSALAARRPAAWHTPA